MMDKKSLSILPIHSAEWIKGRYWYVVDNIRVKKGKSSEILLWIALPVTHRGQDVKIEKIHPKPLEIIHDSVNGNEIVFWRETELENKKRILFYYDFRVLPRKVETKIDPQKITPHQKESEEYKRYIKSEPWIEITPEIKEKALEIVGKEINPYLQAKKIFDWVIENMHYECPNIGERGAKNSFKKLKGDCGEFSVVFTALCRTVGIPARTVTCVWFTGSGHQWAEILLPPYGWIPVDTSAAQMMMPGVETEENIKEFMKSYGIPEGDFNYLFGNLYSNRLMVCIGNNVEAISNKTGVRKIFRFMQPGGIMAFPLAVETKGLSDKTVHVGFYIFGEKRDDTEFAIKKAQKELTPQ